MNNRGSLVDIVMFIVFAVIIAVVSGLMLFAGNTVVVQLQNSTNSVMTSEIVNASMVPVQVAYGNLGWISAFLIFGLIIGLLVGSYLVNVHPIFIIPYLLVILVAVAIAVVISNAYEDIINTPELGTTYSTFTVTNWIMLHLPLVTIVVAFLSLILLLTKFSRGEQYG